MSHDDELKSHYPDVVVAGSLAAALQGALSARNSPLTAEQPLGRWYAWVGLGDRHSQVMVALEHRSFTTDFWHRGVQYGHLWSASLDVVAGAIAQFAEARSAIDEMARTFPDFVPSDGAHAHEKGDFVEFAWNRLLEWSPTCMPDPTVALIRLAHKIPALRRLRPYTSHLFLCFSRTIGFPFSGDCPMVMATGNGLCRVVTPRGTDEHLVFEGSPEDALRAVVANLPDGCAGAIDGTASDL